MAELKKLILSDKQTIPNDDLLSSLMGGKWHLWQEIVKFTEENYKDISSGWNYYNDGKQWLFKLVQKKKTLFWGALYEDTFKITFYFGDKAEPTIIASDLPEPVKHEFMTGKRYGKIRAISQKVFKASDVKVVKKLIDIKSKLK
jgi:hypothetical protein